MSHVFHSSILREYDIRGIFEETLFPDDAYFIGRCYATLFEKSDPQVTVCWDGRLSSPILVENLIAGLVDGGVHVKKVGCGPTPLLYFSVHHLNLDGGIMVTGSHNPKDHNGFKMVLDSGPILAETIQSFREVVAKLPDVPKKGHIEDVDIKGAYVSRLLESVHISHDMKVMWDTGNGAAGEIVSQLIQKLPGHHTLIYGEIDGTFPNHHPDPSEEENLEDLKQVVLQKKADLGFAFDGDGDRLGVIDEMGAMFSIDQMLILLARDVIKNVPNAPIIADIKTSQAFFDDVARQGGIPFIWKTGHSLIKKKMKEVGAPFAGEITGHIFFSDEYYGFDDALYTAIRFLKIISATRKPLSAVRAALPSYYTGPEMRISCDDALKFQIVSQIISDAQKDPLIEKIVDIDGLRAEYSQGWWLVRASNTQNKIVFRAEGKTKSDYENILQRAFPHFQKAGINLESLF